MCIARALIKPADIYVFDDSFSALDYKTDAKLRTALHEEMADKTLIIVAQRLSTIMNADHIIVFRQWPNRGTRNSRNTPCYLSFLSGIC